SPGPPRGLFGGAASSARSVRVARLAALARVLFRGPCLAVAPVDQTVRRRVKGSRSYFQIRCHHATGSGGGGATFIVRRMSLMSHPVKAARLWASRSCFLGKSAR